eukprot:873469-Rhodomonas_salina.2
MWPALTESERCDVEQVSYQDRAGWSLLTCQWCKYKLPMQMQRQWEQKVTLMPGQPISRRKGWWETGNQVATNSKDHLDLWALKTSAVHKEALLQAMKGMGSSLVRQLLAWSTVHEDQLLEDYFSTGQVAHLRTVRGTVVFWDKSVKLSVLENGHTKASLGAGLAYREGDGEDKGFGVRDVRMHIRWKEGLH